MDYEVIYELNSPEFSVVFMIPIILIIITAALLIDSIRTKGKSVSNKILYSVGLILSIAALIYTLIGSYGEYIKYNSALKQGDCLTIEGKIENFNSASVSGHQIECFEISGVIFEYGNEIGNGYSYSDGFADLKNGTDVRITYLNDEGINVILKFEVNINEASQ